MFMCSPPSRRACAIVDDMLSNTGIFKSLKEKNYWIGNYFEDIGLPAHLRRQWRSFSTTWNDLDLDIFMADGGEYRTRRFTEFLYTRSSNILSPLIHIPFFQSRELNKLNGGTQRKFSPITPFVSMHPITKHMIMHYCEIFSALTDHDTWHLNFHQVRISADANMAGKPAPEGIHRDGVSFTTLLCVKRENVEGATNLIYDSNKKELTRVTLGDRINCIILNDENLYHNVTDMMVSSGHDHAQRDMLFIEFTRY